MKEEITASLKQASIKQVNQNITGGFMNIKHSKLHNPTQFINFAHYHIGSKALGPGNRAILWVQGCDRNCDSCISPEWKKRVTANLIEPQALAKLLLKDESITGITISGGEPMLQASQLKVFIEACRKIRDVDIICYTGYTIEEIKADDLHPERAQLLELIDLLIDGPYLTEKDDLLGVRGSSNQNIILLSDRLKSYDFNNSKRTVEMRPIDNNEILMIGIPTPAIQACFSKVAQIRS